MDGAAVKLGILGHVAKDIPTIEELVTLGDALTAIYKVLGADAAKVHLAAVAKNIVVEACSNLVEAHKVLFAAEQAKKEAEKLKRRARSVIASDAGSTSGAWAVACTQSPGHMA